MDRPTIDTVEFHPAARSSDSFSFFVIVGLVIQGQCLHVAVHGRYCSTITDITLQSRLDVARRELRRTYTIEFLILDENADRSGAGEILAHFFVARHLLVEV